MQENDQDYESNDEGERTKVFEKHNETNIIKIPYDTVYI